MPEWAALLEALEQRTELENYRAGLIAAAVYNAAPSVRRRQPVQPMDFFRRRQPVSDPAVKDFELLATLEAIAKCKSQ
jgi:hypothetical protein